MESKTTYQYDENEVMVIFFFLLTSTNLEGGEGWKHKGCCQVNERQHKRKWLYTQTSTVKIMSPEKPLDYPAQIRAWDCWPALSQV